MKVTAPNFVILHGLDGSPVGHWQRWLEEELLYRGLRVRVPEMPYSESPDLVEWIDLLHLTIREAGPDSTVIAHSLGAVLWMQYASRPDSLAVDRVLLVAPPGMVELDELRRVRGHRAHSFHRERIHLAAKNIMMAGSLGDPYCRRGFVDEYANPLAINPIYLPDRFRHVNLESGHGPWPFALRWCLVGTSYAASLGDHDSDRSIFRAYPEPVKRRG
jgi:uncharacterized protein